MNVIYEDNHLLCVEKPVGILAQADISGDPDLLSLCRDYIGEKYNKPGKVYLGLVHRLDRAVGGPMVFARTSKAAARLSEQFKLKTARKIYHAAVAGKPKQPAGELKDFMRKDGKNRIARAAPPDHPEAQEARLNYKVLKTIKIPKREFNNRFQPEAGDDAWTAHPNENHVEISLLEIELLTGRFHQIRFQLSMLGHPILGDVKYKSGFHIRNRAITLEAVTLEIEHPTRKEQLLLEGSRRLAKAFGI